MSLAERAVFLCLHSVGMILFLLGHVVVPLLALGAGQCDPYSHNRYLRDYLLQPSGSDTTSFLPACLPVRKSMHTKNKTAQVGGFHIVSYLLTRVNYFFDE